MAFRCGSSPTHMKGRPIMTAIDALMSADMREAIRLTREGHLAEATALMRRLLHGKRHSGSTPEPWPGSQRPAQAPPSTQHASRVFDVDHTTGAVKNADDAFYRGVTSGGRAAPSIPQTSGMFRGFLDQINCRDDREAPRSNGAYWRASTGRRAVRDGHSCKRAWEPHLQAVCPERSSCRSTRPTRRHAARMHSVA